MEIHDATFRDIETTERDGSTEIRVKIDGYVDKVLSPAAKRLEEQEVERRLRGRRPKVHFEDRTVVVRTPGRQVLMPWRNKAARHPWAHQRDANNRVIPLVDGGGPLPTREV